MLYRCVLFADWLTPGLMGEWWVRAGSGRARSIRKIRFPLSIRNANFFPPAFIREGRGCGEKIFSDRRGRGGCEEAWRRGRVCLSVCLCKSKSYPTALARLKTRPSTCVGS